MPVMGDVEVTSHAGPVGHAEESVHPTRPSSKFDFKVFSAFAGGVFLGDGFVFVVSALPHWPLLPVEGWSGMLGGAILLLSREPVADAQCCAPAATASADGCWWGRQPPSLLQIGGSQSNAVMVCSFLRLPFQVSCHSLPARPQRGEAAPKRVFCCGPRALTSMCVALADHTEVGCTT